MRPRPARRRVLRHLPGAGRRAARAGADDAVLGPVRPRRSAARPAAHTQRHPGRHDRPHRRPGGRGAPARYADHRKSLLYRGSARIPGQQEAAVPPGHSAQGPQGHGPGTRQGGKQEAAGGLAFRVRLRRGRRVHRPHPGQYHLARPRASADRFHQPEPRAGDSLDPGPRFHAPGDPAVQPGAGPRRPERSRALERRPRRPGRRRPAGGAHADPGPAGPGTQHRAPALERPRAARGLRSRRLGGPVLPRDRRKDPLPGVGQAPVRGPGHRRPERGVLQGRRLRRARPGDASLAGPLRRHRLPGRRQGSPVPRDRGAPRRAFAAPRRTAQPDPRQHTVDLRVHRLRDLHRGQHGADAAVPVVHRLRGLRRRPVGAELPVRRQHPGEQGLPRAQGIPLRRSADGSPHQPARPGKVQFHVAYSRHPPHLQ